MMAMPSIDFSIWKLWRAGLNSAQIARELRRSEYYIYNRFGALMDDLHERKLKQARTYRRRLIEKELSPGLRT